MLQAAPESRSLCRKLLLKKLSVAQSLVSED
jgi:hypothetical protein